MKTKSVSAGRVGRAARARAEHHADLRDDAGGPGVALEDAAVPGERGDALLDTGARAVVQRDQRRTGRDGHVHDLVDLRGVGLAQRAAEDPEVVRVDEDRAALDRAPAGDHTVGVRLLRLQAEPGRPVPAQLLDLAGTSPRPAAARCAPGRSACPWRAAPRSPSRWARASACARMACSSATRPRASVGSPAGSDSGAPRPKRSCSDHTKPTKETGPSTPHSLRTVFLVPLNRTTIDMQAIRLLGGLRLVGVAQSVTRESSHIHEWHMPSPG